MAESIVGLQVELAKTGKRIQRVSHGISRLAMFEDALLSVKNGDSAAPQKDWPMRNPSKFLQGEKEHPEVRFERLKRVETALDRTWRGYDLLDRKREEAVARLLALNDSLQKEIPVLLQNQTSVNPVQSSPNGESHLGFLSEDTIRRTLDNGKVAEIALKILAARSEEDCAVRCEMIGEHWGDVNTTTGSQYMSRAIGSIRALFREYGLEVKDVFEKREGSVGKPKTRGYYTVLEEAPMTCKGSENNNRTSSGTRDDSRIKETGATLSDSQPIIDAGGPMTLERLSEELKERDPERYDGSGRPILRKTDFSTVASLLDYHNMTLRTHCFRGLPEELRTLFRGKTAPNVTTMTEIYQPRLEILEALIVLHSLSPSDYFHVYQAQDEKGRALLDYCRKSLKGALPMLLEAAKKDVAMAKRWDEKRAKRQVAAQQKLVDTASARVDTSATPR